MEFAGINGAQLMQGWIREEFAYITRKRDCGTSDFEEERRIRQELQLPEFDGRDCDDWILEMEDIFHFFRLNEEAKLKAAIIGLHGDALRWFEEEHRRRPFSGWQDLKNTMMRCFDSSPSTLWLGRPTPARSAIEVAHQIRRCYGVPPKVAGGGTLCPGSPCGVFNINGAFEDKPNLAGDGVVGRVAPGDFEGRSKYSGASASSSGLGGGPGKVCGSVAGNCTFGGGTATCSGRKNEGNGFERGGFEASGSGGGPVNSAVSCTRGACVDNVAGRFGSGGAMERNFLGDEYGKSLISTDLEKVLEIVGKGSVVNCKRDDVTDDEERYCLMKIPEEVKCGERLNGVNVELENNKALAEIINGNLVNCQHNYSWAEGINFGPLYSCQTLDMTTQGKEKGKMRCIQPIPSPISEPYSSTLHSTYQRSPKTIVLTQHVNTIFTITIPTSPTKPLPYSSDPLPLNLKPKTSSFTQNWTCSHDKSMLFSSIFIPLTPMLVQEALKCQCQQCAEEGINYYCQGRNFVADYHPPWGQGGTLGGRYCNESILGQG